MKKLILITLLQLLLPALALTQSNVRQKLVVSEKIVIRLFFKTNLHPDKYTFKNFLAETEPPNSLLLFLNHQPIVKLPTPFKNSVLIYTEFSYPDFMENAINSFTAGGVNKYDDQVAELFREAPSLFKLKCNFGF